MVDLQRSPTLSRCTSSSQAVCCTDIQSQSTSAVLVPPHTQPLQVTYDLHQLDPANLLPLRDTLILALRSYHTGPRTIITQLCLAISGLALQLPLWDNAVQNMIDAFGPNPATVPVLLQFLKILPEELTGNTRIPVTVSVHAVVLSFHLTF